MDVNEGYFKLEFICNHILFRSPENHYTIMNAKILDITSNEVYSKSTVTVRGVFEKIEERDAFKCFAKWVDDKKYGRQIEAFAPIMVASSDIDGIKRFLRRFVKGAGKVTINKIVDLYGLNSLDKIRETPDNLSCIKGITAKKAESIHRQIIQNEGVEQLSLFLFNHGVTNFNDILSVYDSLGEDAEAKILANPYCICDYLSISKLPIADTIALKLGFSPTSIVRLSKMIQLYLANHCFSSGDMYIVKDYLIKTLGTYIKKCGFDFPFSNIEDLEKAISYMEDTNIIVCDNSSSNEEILYLKSLFTIEDKTADLIKKINIRRIPPQRQTIYDDFFKNYAKKTGIEADDVQKEAVRLAYENRFSVLTGGPGTGKTQTINAIISFIEKERPNANIVLCAPTGKASKRMSELTGKEAYTIHRLLGIISNDEYDTSITYDIDADFVIVDEASMIGSALFYKLLTAVANNKHCSLLLVGDKDQLPPVDVGLPFKDIIESNKVPTIRLEKLYRQASKSQINRNAKLVLNGVTDFGKNGLTFDKEKQDFFFFETEDTTFARTLIINSIKQLTALGISFDDIVVLSPIKKSVLGVEEINKLIQQEFNPYKSYENEYKGINYILRINDRVMQTTNDYELGVFNGDTGIVTDINMNDEELTVSYDDSVFKNGKLVLQKKQVVYSFALAKNLVLAYSTTVHKAQGSEYPVVIMPISNMFYNLSRNIIYTAITRAKNRFVMIGTKDALIGGIIKNDNTQRRTMLKERI